METPVPSPMHQVTRLKFVRPEVPTTWSICLARYADLLESGQVYEVERVEVRDFHTRVYLKGFDVPFNSVWFSEAPRCTNP